MNRKAIAEGQAHLMAGRLHEAQAVYQRVLKSEPNNPDALHLLGVIAHRQGDTALTVKLIAKAIIANPRVPAFHNNLGNALKARGRRDEAMAAFREALRLNPDHVEAHNNLGNGLRDLGRLEDAVAAYNKALAIRPAYVQAHNNLGNVLTEMGLVEEAVASFERALARAPDYAEAHNNLGIALKLGGDLEAAMASYHKALALRPDYAEALYNLCEVFEKTNNTEALRETVASARHRCPADPRFALREAQLLKRDGEYGRARVVLEAAETEINDDNFSSTRIHLLGELCDRLNDTEAAFAYFSAGNRRIAARPPAQAADGGAYTARIDALSDRFTSDWVSSWRTTRVDDQRPDPVFLVGFPRSGTTLLDTILRSHGAIEVVEEKPTVRNMNQAAGELAGGSPDALAELDEDQLAALRRIYFSTLDKHLESRDRAGIVVDKLPLNAIEAGLIHRVFPHARFLFVQRHPCDCVLSCFMQNFEINDAMVNFLDLEHTARLYDKVMRLWQQYQTVLPLDVHTLRYESLIESFEETLAPLLAFLGLDWDDRLWAYAETASARGMINTPSYNQVTQPLYSRAHGRWRRYREPMAGVLPLLLPWAQRLGYDED